MAWAQDVTGALNNTSAFLAPVDGGETPLWPNHTAKKKQQQPNETNFDPTTWN